MRGAFFKSKKLTFFTKNSPTSNFSNMTQTKQQGALSRFSWLLSIALIIGTPLHALISTFLKFKWGWVNVPHLNLFAQAWKEGFVLSLCILALIQLYLNFKADSIQDDMRSVEQKNSSRPGFKSLHSSKHAVHKYIPHPKLIFFILIYMAVGLLVTLLNWQNTGVSHLAWGARTEWSFLLLLMSWLILIPNWTKKQKDKALKILLSTGLGVLIFGLIIGLFGHETLTFFGFRDDWSTFYLGQAPAYCQRESATTFCRWQSTFSGPNRYAAYLLSLIPLCFFFFKKFMRKHKSAATQALQMLLFTSIILGLISLVNTLSTSAQLALVTTLGVFAFFGANTWLNKRIENRLNKKNVHTHSELLWKSLKALLWITPPLLFICATLFISTQTNYLTGASESAHLTRGLDGLQKLMAAPFGSGIASSGPASYKVGLDFIPENWFLQVAINSGFAGLFLFLGIWIKIIWKLLKQMAENSAEKLNKALPAITLFALLALLTQNLFLHTLEDIGSVLPVMLLVGLSFSLHTEIN
jgi:hypothetical protein